MASIKFFDKGIQIPKLQRNKIKNIIFKLIDDYGYSYDSINIIFCSDEEILKLNNLYLNHDYFTDIITFNYNSDKIISGDLFIGLETVKTNAEKYQVDYHSEIIRVIIHGILHLTGQNDKTKSEQKKMTELENAYLQLFFHEK
jgi:probable rRNA maturation factor